jgi:hypothetical protein
MIVNTTTQATRKHLARLMNAARLAGDIELYVDLQAQLAATYK